MLHIALLLALAQSSTAETKPANEPIAVPAGRAPVLDGELGADEWNDAAIVARANVGTASEVRLLAKHADGKLWLAVGAPKSAITTLGVARDEKHVTVLHASQALGAVEYTTEPGASAWKRGADFTWRCRDDAAAEKRAAERAVHLAEQGWTATTMKMGAGRTELALGAPFLEVDGAGVTTVRVALSLFGGSALLAPASLADGLKNGALQMGMPPAELTFAPRTWLVLRLDPPAAAPATPTSAPEKR